MNQLLLFGLVSQLVLLPAEAQTMQRQEGIRGVIKAGTTAQVIKDGFHFLEGPAPTPEGELYFSDITITSLSGVAAQKEPTACIRCSTGGFYVQKRTVKG